jgi:glutamine synthetase
MTLEPDLSNNLIARLEQNKTRYIDLQFTDIVGMVKNVTIPAAELGQALENGAWFDGSCIEGFARIAESDMHLRPDPATFAILPWLSGEEATARLICDIYTPDGQPFQADPRAALRRVLKTAAGMGFGYNTTPEIEFFLFKPHADGSLLPLDPHDQAGYFDAPSDMASGLRRQMANTLANFGIKVESMHHEVSTGQHELDFRYADALTTADSAVTLRLALKIIAQQNGLYCTFLPKPIRGISGSGMHVHQSLAYIATGKNAFADPGDAHGLSKIAKQFIAGQLAHARGMCAILAPLVNSYKRLSAGYEAPVHISWARTNQSALIRVPRATKAESTRLELRCPDPSCNPYLAFAVMLAAGLDGIRRDLPLPAANEENTYDSAAAYDLHRRTPLGVLPTSLSQALEALEADEVVREALGVQIFDRFINAKRLEWEDYRLEVSPWELEKYLGIY